MLEANQMKDFTYILEKELVPAMGCTEPIAVALAGAIAHKTLGEPVVSLRVGCSGKIVKNVKSVRIPGTEGLAGIEAAALAGAIAGDAEAGMQVLARVTDAQKKEITAAVRRGACESYRLDTAHELHISLDARGETHSVRVEVQGAHDRVTRLERDGEILINLPEESPRGNPVISKERAGLSALTIARIKEYADTVELDAIRPILAPQIDCNMAIAREGLSGGYGLNYGMTLLGADPDVYQKMEAYAAAASEARMSGCPMPVIINSGSGNQGIASSVPSVVYCTQMGYSEERMFRMLAFANLATIYQKQFIGKLSAFCGAISAACASGAALSYIEGGSVEQIGNTISNALAVMAGVICDGAKASCGAKIAAGLHAAFIAHRQAMAGLAYRSGDGIVSADADATIRNVGRIAREGMGPTDEQIIEVMLDN